MKVSAGPFSALLIDWDGTLIDSLPLKIANAASLFSERFGAVDTQVTASYAQHSGVPRRILFDRIAIDCIGRRLTEEEFEEVSNRFTERNNQVISKEGRLRPGSFDTLTSLKDLGVLTFISTSAAQEEITALSRHFGLDTVCTGILGSRPFFSKGPEHTKYVRERHHLKAEQIAGIGDDVADIALFEEARIYGIGITGTRRREELLDAGARLVVDRLEEVLAYVA
jgi:phosphoglycolate phosphatase-like HAD superfamily hydrolase